MKHILKEHLAIIFFFVAFQLQGQITEFYNSKGQLLVDTNFTISDYSNIPGGVCSNLVYPIISRVKFPSIASDAGLSSLVILEFQLIPSEDNDRYVKYSIKEIIPVTGGNVFKESLELKELYEYLSERSIFFPSNYLLRKPYKFYIPIKFEIETGEEYRIEKYYEKGVIIFKATVVPVIDRNKSN